MLAGFRLFTFRAGGFGAQTIHFSLELFGGSSPMLCLFFPAIAAASGVGRTILKAFDLPFEFLILGFPRFHTGFEQPSQLAYGVL